MPSLKKRLKKSQQTSPNNPPTTNPLLDIKRAFELATKHRLTLHCEVGFTYDGRPIVNFLEGGTWIARGDSSADDALADLAVEGANALLFLRECVSLTPEDLGEDPYRAAHGFFAEIDRLEELAIEAEGAGSFDCFVPGWPPGELALEGEFIRGISRWVRALVGAASDGVFNATPSRRRSDGSR